MKKTVITSLVLITIILASCKNTEKNNPQVDQENRISSTSVKPLLAQASLESDISQTVYYVTAGSGLSLRAGSNLNSKKILTLPYGAQVKFIDSPAHTEMTVAGIQGKMLEIEYQGAKGFAFNGYLSSLAPPQADEDIETYAKRISTNGNFIEVEKTPSKNGEDYGMTTSIELPAKSWNEMYRISKRLFHLPKTINPDFNGIKSTRVIVNKNKRERTFTDELQLIVGGNGVIDSLVYTYKLRDYERKVTLSKTRNGYKAVEIEISQ